MFIGTHRTLMIIRKKICEISIVKLKCITAVCTGLQRRNREFFVFCGNFEMLGFNGSNSSFDRPTHPNKEASSILSDVRLNVYKMKRFCRPFLSVCHLLFRTKSMYIESDRYRYVYVYRFTGYLLHSHAQAIFRL